MQNLVGGFCQHVKRFTFILCNTQHKNNFMRLKRSQIIDFPGKPISKYIPFSSNKTNTFKNSHIPYPRKSLMFCTTFVINVFKKNKKIKRYGLKKKEEAQLSFLKHKV